MEAAWKQVNADLPDSQGNIVSLTAGSAEPIKPRRRSSEMRLEALQMAHQQYETKLLEEKGDMVNVGDGGSDMVFTAETEESGEVFSTAETGDDSTVALVDAGHLAAVPPPPPRSGCVTA